MDTKLNKNINVRLSIKNVNPAFSNASVNMTKYGHVVILSFYDFSFIDRPEGQDVIIAEGLPVPIYGAVSTVLTPTYFGSVGLRVAVRQDGKLVYWWVSPDANANTVHDGQFVYFTND